MSTRKLRRRTGARVSTTYFIILPLILSACNFSEYQRNYGSYTGGSICDSGFICVSHEQLHCSSGVCSSRGKIASIAIVLNDSKKPSCDAKKPVSCTHVHEFRRTKTGPKPTVYCAIQRAYVLGSSGIKPTDSNPYRLSWTYVLGYRLRVLRSKVETASVALTRRHARQQCPRTRR